MDVFIIPSLPPMLSEELQNSRAPWLQGYYPPSLLTSPSTTLPPSAPFLVSQLWCLPSYRRISLRGGEGFPALKCALCRRAVAIAPPERSSASAGVRLPVVPSPYACRLGLWGMEFSRSPLRSLSLR